MAFSSGRAVLVFPFLLFLVGMFFLLPFKGLSLSDEEYARLIGIFFIAGGVWWLAKHLLPCPWVKGIYVFPGAWVDATSDVLRIIPFDRVPTPTVVVRNGSLSQVHIGGAEIDLNKPDWEGLTPLKRAERSKVSAYQAATNGTLLVAYSRARAIYAHARSSGDAEVLRFGNPFHDCEASGQWEAKEPAGPRCIAKPPKHVGWLVVLVVVAGSWLLLDRARQEQVRKNGGMLRGVDDLERVLRDCASGKCR
jgi:hypothetical protein